MAPSAATRRRAASLAVLDHDRAEGWSIARRGRTAIMDASRAMADRYPVIGDVRGRGAMCAIELVEDRRTKEPLGAGP